MNAARKEFGAKYAISEIPTSMRSVEDIFRKKSTGGGTTTNLGNIYSLDDSRVEPEEFTK